MPYETRPDQPPPQQDETCNYYETSSKFCLNMFPFEKFLSRRTSDPDGAAYESVALRADENGEPTPENALRMELAKVQKKLKFFRTAFYLAHVFQALFFFYFMFGKSDSSHPVTKYRDLEWSGLLGEDWNGLIPNGIGYPLKPIFWGEDHPYYMPENMFDDFDKSMAKISHWKYMHNSSSIFIGKDKPRVKRIKPDGGVEELPPFWPWEPLEDGRELYAIRGFHQMHCIFVLSEEFTYHYADTNDSLWPAGHVAHCINTLRDAIMCMADAQPLSYVNGYKNGHATDGQAMMCRDWEELHKFVTAPERGLRIKNVAPPGSKMEKMAPIVPYPDLTEEELRGVA
ncbi:uncharacterized protein RCO7_07702 [Rhynchosporium graminicola]|uniref:Uncharacterized protein n=1 Tax=Rhynchosporium graminicola TaxID=2792576 RepID=A0A1E1LPP5_9HELO|nr:uncharacterized protein RCO7_07702 [Rhynchosporium commune]